MGRSVSNHPVVGGVSVSTTLFLIFLILKLTGNIQWSWWWIFAPYWIPLALILGIIIIIMIVSVI
jgi:hypothetical protein